MVSLGILTLQPNQETTYFTEMAKRSAKYGIQVIRFLPGDWEPGDHTVIGSHYQNSQNAWEYNLFPLPDFIYDRCYYSNRAQFRQHHPIVKQLKKKTTFLSTGLPNKWRVDRTLRSDPVISHFLPKTKLITSTDDVVQWLEAEPQLVLKPKSGSQGKGILFITKKHGTITIQTHMKRTTKSVSTQSIAAFKKWLNRIVAKKQWIAQPLLPLSNQYKQPFDLRILIQKNDKGKWQESGRGLRVGKKGNLISNIHHGGKVVSYEKWLRKQPATKQKQINNQVQKIIASLPPALETNYKKLFEIGIDIGIDQQGRCWLLEANSKPGHQVVLKTNPIARERIYSRPLAYCQYLAQGVIQK